MVLHEQLAPLSFRDETTEKATPEEGVLIIHIGSTWCYFKIAARIDLMIPFEVGTLKQNDRFNSITFGSKASSTTRKPYSKPPCWLIKEANDLLRCLQLIHACKTRPASLSHRVLAK